MRARLIFNPVATMTNAGVRDALVALLGAEVELTVVGTRARLHAADLAREAVADGLDAVFVLGGDGTANEVLQGLAGTDVPLGLLPGGGANVLARAIGLPRDASEAATVQLERLHADHDARLGLGRANGRLFGFQAGMGLDAGIVRRVEAHPGMKRWLRQLSFILLGLREWATSEDRRAPACRATDLPGIDATPRMLVSVANLDPYTYLGPRPFHLLPAASAQTALDVLTAETMSTPAVLRGIVRAFIDGSHVDDPRFTMAHDVDAVTITADRPTPLMVDGDLMDHVRTATFRHVPNALRVLADLEETGAEEPLADDGRAA